MKKFWKNPVIAFLSSLKLSAAIMVLVAIASAKATFIESDFGRDAAYDLIYAAWWFEALLGLLIVSLTLLFFRRWPYKPKQTGFVLVHVSIIIILVAAAMTRHLGFEGTMRIREGESASTFYSEKPHIQAQIDGKLASFGVRLWRPGENDLFKTIHLDGRTYELGASEYWPAYAETWQPGPGGRPALQYGLARDGEVSDEMLVMGDRTQIGNAQVRYIEDPFRGEASTSRYGDVRIHIDGESCSFPVGLPDGQVHECGGYRFELTEFQTAFRVGAGSSADGPMTNPMVRLTITGPEGATGERLLFALHPDFSMGHSGGEQAFSELDLLYQVNSGLELAPGGETGLQGRASFELMTMNMETEERGKIPAGSVFDVVESTLYVNDANAFSFVAGRIHDSVVLGPSLSPEQNAPAAARLVIRDDQGNEASAICQKYGKGERVQLGEQTVTLKFGPVVRSLPYEIFLDDFVLETYPGSDNPATYESFVTLNDPQRGVTGRKVHIYMNNPLTYRGTKHFQSSYDMDRKGTVLSLNKDPGKWPTYFGYTLLTVGFLLIILKDLLWPRRKRSAEAKSPAATKAAVVALACLLTGSIVAPMVGSARAQTGHEGHDHGPVPEFVALSDPAREVASRLIVQDFRGRMKPLDTLAREMVMKVAKKTKFQDRQPVDMYLNWTANASSWWERPCIAVRYQGLKDLLGVDASVKHVSPASLYSNGQYRLNDLVEEAHRTPDRERSKTQRKLISFDERFHLLYMTFQGQSLRVFPVPGDENHTWLDVRQVAGQVDEQTAATYQAAFGELIEGLHTGDNGRILNALKQIDGFQKQYGAEVLPSDLRLNAELTYNRAHVFSWMMIPLLGSFIILVPLYIWNLFRNQGRRLSFRNPFYTFGVAIYIFAFVGMVFGYVLRWIASGRAPLSNGHESLLFISLSIVLAGLVFELAYRLAAPAGLAGLLTVVVLGVSMLSVFDPAIGPLVPVLVSYWLNIHVTVITASYGFLGLAALIGALVLILLMLPASKNRENVRDAIKKLDGINHHVLIAGLGLLSVGTLLGGVWANESWGRYWGWDAKETWSLITILAYAVVLHFRWIPQIRSVWLSASGSLAAIGSVIMTYFGVNYFLTGLHSYAQGDAAEVPDWVYIFTVCVLLLIAVSGLVQRRRGLMKA